MASISPDARRNTPAANADILGDDATFDAVPAKASEAPRASSSESEGPGPRREADGQAQSGEARPGKDINQAGFIKDKGEDKP